jgi:hypothetical protein
MCSPTTTAAGQPSEASQKALESAAAKGSLPAQYALGAAAEAEGNFVLAAAWYRRAAELGYAGAEFKYAEMLENGKGVFPDRPQAVEWYRRAATKGFAPAVARLGALSGGYSSASPDLGGAASPVGAGGSGGALPGGVMLGAERPRTLPTPSARPPAPVVQASPGGARPAGWKGTILIGLPVLSAIVSVFVGWRVIRPKLLKRSALAPSGRPAAAASGEDREGMLSFAIDLLWMVMPWVFWSLLVAGVFYMVLNALLERILANLSGAG